jgi:VWFA-related protein
MKHSTVAAALPFLVQLSVSGFSQSSQPAPGPTPDRDVVRISTSLIQLDVTVTDKKGNPISDLRPDEVELFQNGKKKKITNFSFVAGTRTQGKPETDVTGKTLNGKPPILPASPVRLDSVRRTVAIVVDDLNMSWPSSVWAKDALRKFVKDELQDGDLVAIIRTAGSSGMLQQFTTDRRQLLASIERRFSYGGLSFLKQERDIGGVKNPREGEMEALRDRIFGEGTIGVLNFVVRGMRDLPGRKSLVFITDRVVVGDSGYAGTPSFSLNVESVRRLIDNANRASVSFYPIHAPGLVVPMMSAEDDVIDIKLPGGEHLTDAKLFGREGRQHQIINAQDGLRFLAEHTGGFAVINSNSITKGLRRIMDDQSYYLVAYDPDDDMFQRSGPFAPPNSKYNTHEIKVSRPGARVRFRTGFLGVSNEKDEQKPVGTVTEQIITAITSPFTSNELDVRMNAIYMADEKRKPSVVSFINIDPAELTFIASGNGLQKASFDMVAFTFDAEGRVVDERSKNFTVTVTKAQHEVLMKRGLIATFGLPLKKVGGHQFRLAVRDTATGRIGTAYQFVDVPPVSSGKFGLSGAILSSGSSGLITAKDAVTLDVEDPMRYTSVREFRSGTPLEFSLFAYNPKLDSSKKPNLLQSYKLYKDNQVVFTSTERRVVMEDQPSVDAVAVSGGLMLGSELLPGDYSIEVMVRDQNDKNRVVSQFIQFEIVN